MKKLFALHPSIILDEFNSLRITGFYQLKALSEQSVSFQTDDFFLTIQGEEVTVLALTEQNAHISIIELKDLSIRYKPNEGPMYES
ncbi:YabP/YqfC family sporulation protein [Mammaliicoccus sciuri]|uniref:YabP family protein n=1 Tax=Sporosarcina newyorkensis TaxID=759851 RepID=A0A1T4XGF0_9BACL|nr:YabP/YqfC family sporulation protein [Sporosarcina newyorkensis]MBY0220952.1 hypothetical protein [Sporosarcina aquimarina]SKA88171.1 YabP family protein [Sporosarcina newyorkensis]